MKSSATYARIGAFLALGAPAGMLMLRAGLARDLSWRFLVSDLRAEPALYAYVTVSTLIAFTLFGAFTGRQADALADLSRVDHLTGLANRRAIEDLTRLEHARARRQETTMAFLVLDVDRLKEINDREGHGRGDAALRTVAEVMKSSARAGDVCARWGGDEFAVLAPSTDEAQARSLGERIRVGVQTRAADLTVSIGIATLRPRAEPAGTEGLFARADAALYDAKREGRNRVVVDPRVHAITG